MRPYPGLSPAPRAWPLLLGFPWGSRPRLYAFVRSAHSRNYFIALSALADRWYKPLQATRQETRHEKTDRDPICSVLATALGRQLDNLKDNHYPQSRQRR